MARLARRPFRTVRPSDAADVYSHPRQQLAKLTGNGGLVRIATGYYIVVPRANQHRPWVPQLEAVAAGIGAADFGPDSAILMGVSAARLHGAIPRSVATAVVAAPRRRRRLLDRPADVVFVKRDTTRLDAVRTATELGMDRPEGRLLRRCSNRRRVLNSGDRSWPVRQGWTSVRSKRWSMCGRPGVARLPEGDGHR